MAVALSSAPQRKTKYQRNIKQQQRVNGAAAAGIAAYQRIEKKENGMKAMASGMAASWQRGNGMAYGMA